MDIQWIEADGASPSATYDALDETLETYPIRRIWYIVEAAEDVARAARELGLRDYTVAAVANADDVRRFAQGYANVAMTTKDEFAAREADFLPLAGCVDVFVMDNLDDHAAFACIRWWRAARPATLRVLWT
jgi:hypothetical protein